MSSSDNSLEGATINVETRTMKINSFGGNLEDATINVKNDGIAGNLNFYGYGAAKNAQINCEDGATCNIVCAIDACDGLDIYVDWSSNYTLNCYDSGNEDCATVSREPSAAPTMEPTTPTVEPTSPTPEPTHASDEPTAEPTESPIPSPTSHNITCDGTRSCEYQTLTADYIDCNGFDACYLATVNAQDKVRCTVNEACDWATITTEDLLCPVTWGCVRTKATATNIYCSAYSKIVTLFFVNSI